MSKGIIVLGMHRSGTSLIAELIHRWGAFGRVNECLPSNQWNARGYWELAPLVSFNRRLLREVNANWSFPPSQRRDSYLADLARRPEYRDEALRLIASMGRQDCAWFWKDPRLSLLLPFWQELWEEPRYVICLRDPVEIWRSLSKRDNLSFSVSMMLWHRYMLSALKWTRNRPAIVLSYSRILHNPELECQRLANFLSERDGQPDPARAAAEMKKAVHQDLRHYKANSRNLFALMSGRQQNLQRALDGLADSGELSSVDLESFSLPPAWRVFLRAELLLLRCGKRWNRLFPGLAAQQERLSAAEELAVSYARGLGVLDVNAQFSSHSGFLMDSLLKNGYSEPDGSS